MLKGIRRRRLSLSAQQERFASEDLPRCELCVSSDSPLRIEAALQEVLTRDPKIALVMGIDGSGNRARRLAKMDPPARPILVIKTGSRDIDLLFASVCDDDRKATLLTSRPRPP